MKVCLQGGLDVTTQAKTECFFGILSTRRKGSQTGRRLLVVLQVILVLVVELLGVKGLTQRAGGRHGVCGWVGLFAGGFGCFVFVCLRWCLANDSL